MNVRLIVSVLLFAFATAAFSAGKETGRPKAPKQKTDPTESLFASNAPIRTFKIQVSGAEWAALQKDDRTYTRAKLTVGTNVYPDVGIRVKGNGSRRGLNDKPSVVVKFDHYVPDQKFCGLTKISLNSSSQDATYLADMIANSLFADANVPVSRVTHARMVLNGRELGLYVLVEMHNREFLKRWFHNSNGSLYEAYLTDVDSQMDQDHGGDTTQNDRKRFAEVVKIPDAVQRWQKLPEVLDVDRYVSHLVCEIFTGHTDGYAMNRNNYRIYHNPDTDRFTFIAHGIDWGFQNTGVSIKPPLNSLVTRAVMSAPEGNKLYNERLRLLFTNAFHLEVLTNRVNAAVGRLLTQAQSTNEAKDFLRYGAEMNSRLVSRWQNLTNQLYGPPPIPLAFDSHGIARLSGWHKKTARGSASALHERTTEPSRHVLHISTITNGPCVASWRTKVLLPPGTYVFEGEARGVGIVAQTNQTIGAGAGLRLSMGRRENKLEGDMPWTRLRCSVTNLVEDGVEFVCELRAMKGEVWFDEDSLRVVRTKANAVAKETK